MRILQLIDGLNVGGAEVLLYGLVQYLLAQGHQVHVAYSTPGPMLEPMTATGVPLTRLPRLARVDPILFFGILQTIHRFQPDLVHTHLFKSDLHGRLAARLSGVPVVISTAHNNDMWAKHAPLGYLYGLTSKLVDRVIAVSDEVRAHQIDYTYVRPEKIITISNGVDVHTFENQDRRHVRNELGIGDAPLIGIIGRLSPQKDHQNFLRAAVKIRQALPATRFLIVGDGPLKEELTLQAYTLGLGDAIFFCGLRHDIPAVLAALDVLVFSSLWEGLPVTLLEGMAASRPIVSTAVGGVGEVIVNEKSGLLVPASNSDMLADACLRVLNDSSLAEKLARNGYTRVCEHYSSETMLKRTVELYEELWRHVKITHS
jgi:glycosyltransferase involved in cell wall biosynthesis